MTKVVPDPYVNQLTVRDFDCEANSNQISVIVEYMGLPRVEKWNIDQRRPEQPSFTSERITFLKYVTGTSDLIIGMDVTGDEREQLFLLKENGMLIPLTHSPEHVHLYGGSSPDGKWIAWSSNRQNPAFLDIYIQSLETYETHLVFAGDGMFTVERWFPNGNALLVRRTNSALDQDLGILSLLTGNIDWITEHSGEASYRNIHFSNNGDEIYLLSNKDSEFYGLACIHLPTKQLTWLLRGNWDFEGLTLNKENNMFAFTENQGGISKGYLFDLNQGALYTWETPMGVITNLTFLLQRQMLLFKLNGPAHPSELWALHLPTLQVQSLMNISKPLIEGKLANPKLLSYRSFDGLQIPFFYYKPEPAAQKHPVVIYLHGGPESQSRASYNPLFEYLQSKGFCIAAPNFRGSTGYGKTYTQLDDVRKRMDALKDVISLVDFLKQDPDIDASKIAVLGGSYGGFLTLAAISHYPNLWVSAVDIVGMSSLRTFIQTTSPWRKRLREIEYGTVKQDEDFFNQIDPLNHADRITAPLLVIHGVNDPRVSIDESEQIVNKLKQREHPVTFHRIEGEGHNLVKPEDKIYVYSMVAAFLEQYMGRD
ncbi:S9 family peptidase [Oceanobacillus chungangensis]|uniref:S9 family peptidase n=1 Tax=Oceanobacillus chungangensis TaxID=1229152 RepID=A0A3D8PS94_9BACI|nr:S9 family peptidase [Oceanobacillus chungangensis]RDW18592.1 S9 family peptidase [Oceanobacillus chungangensis]